LLSTLAGRRIAQTTTSRWAKGTRMPPPCALALLGLVARIPPAELARWLAD
jgi:DNA-binding transcriptional regulator YiaG